MAIFYEDRWPKALAVNGFVSLEGQKMSKSKGPLLTLSEAVSKYGADISRMYILSSAEQTQDADWKNSGIEAARKQVERFYGLVSDVIGSGVTSGMGGNLKLIDRWMLSKLQNRISETSEALASIQTRHALQNSFFLLYNDVKWYQRRGGDALLYDVVDTWVRLLTPVTPHLCEEIWEAMGHDEGDFIALAQYPEYNPEYVDKAAELAEELVSNTLSDVEEIIKVTKISPSKLVLYTTPAWKMRAFKLAISMQKEGNLNVGALIKTLMADPENKRYGKEVPKFVQKLVPDVTAMSDGMLETLEDFDLDEEATLKEAADFFENEVGCPVEVYSADNPNYDPENKSRFAVALRPAIYLEE